MKLSNKFALISGLASFATGTPLMLSCIRWTIPLEKQNKTLLFILFLSLILAGLFYLYHKNRLQKAISEENQKAVYDTPLIAGLHAFLNFGILILLFSLIFNPILDLTALKNILKIGVYSIPIGLVELSIIYYLGFVILTPYYSSLEEAKFTGLNLTQKILLLGAPAIIFSVFTGYILTKSWFAIIYLLFPSFLIWILIKMIKEPIVCVQQRIQKSLNEPLTSSGETTKLLSGDEIALLNDFFTLFLKRTTSIISKIKETADTVKTQGEAILSGIRKLSSTSQQIDNSAREILTNKDESALAVNSVEKQNEELSALSAEIESQVKTLTNTSKKSIELANSGETKSEEGVNKINSFVRKIEEGSKSLEELSSAFDEIKEFNSLMEQISDDTNLLALNASIEATRKKGDESKGFSVIADEIRKLSNDSASYLEKTKDNIKRMSDAVKSIVESTEKSKAIFEDSKSIIKKTAEDLKEISESIGMSTNMADQIYGILKEESNSIEEIKKSTKKLSSINEQQTESVLTLSKETEEQVALMKDTETRAQTLLSLLGKIQENSDTKIE
jgi:methyl-accepting chemotaxis protein